MISNTGKLAGRTLFITGASRGIGKAIALKAARDGANIIIAAKTATAHPKLPGTIYTAAEEIEKAGGKALPCVVDVRDENQVREAITQAVNKFGGIDILVNNASAISLTPTESTDMKKYDLMHQINTRGTFLVSKECLPYLQKSSHAHILNISPPLNMDPAWFSNHVAYTMAKYGMSMCVLGMAREYEGKNIAVNALWPRTAIYTAAMEMLAGDSAADVSRVPEIMADAAYVVLSKQPKDTTGKFLIDDEVLSEAGVKDFKPYAYNPANHDKLMPDFFLGSPDYTKLTAPPVRAKTISPEKFSDRPVTSSSDDIMSIIEKIVVKEHDETENAASKYDFLKFGLGNFLYFDLNCLFGTPDYYSTEYEEVDDLWNNSEYTEYPYLDMIMYETDDANCVKSVFPMFFNNEIVNSISKLVCSNGGNDGKGKDKDKERTRNGPLKTLFNGFLDVSDNDWGSTDGKATGDFSLKAELDKLIKNNPKEYNEFQMKVAEWERNYAERRKQANYICTDVKKPDDAPKKDIKIAAKNTVDNDKCLKSDNKSVNDLQRPSNIFMYKYNKNAVGKDCTSPNSIDNLNDLEHMKHLKKQQIRNTIDVSNDKNVDVLKKNNVIVNLDLNTCCGCSGNSVLYSSTICDQIANVDFPSNDGEKKANYLEKYLNIADLNTSDSFPISESVDLQVQRFLQETPSPTGQTGDSNIDFSGKIGELFKTISANLSPEIVQKTNAVFQFEVTGSEKGTWYLDLKEGSGSVGRGPPTNSKADAILTMDTDNFLKMFGGQLKPAVAYMMGKLKIAGDLQKAMKLEKLMAKLKSKL